VRAGVAGPGRVRYEVRVEVRAAYDPIDLSEDDLEKGYTAEADRPPTDSLREVLSPDPTPPRGTAGAGRRPTGRQPAAVAF
jgi:hypothetical protein